MGLLFDLKRARVSAREVLAAIANGKRANPIVVSGRGHAKQSDTGTVVFIDADEPAGFTLALGEVRDHGPAGEADFGDGLRQWVELAYLLPPPAPADPDDPPPGPDDQPAEMGTNSADGAYDVEIVAATHVAALTGTPLTAPLDAGTAVVLLAAADRAWNRRWLILGTGGATLPIGQYQDMMWGNIADNATGFKFISLHAIPL